MTLDGINTPSKPTQINRRNIRLLDDNSPKNLLKCLMNELRGTPNYPISKLTSALGRLQIGNHVGPTSASDVGPTSSCSSVRRRADVYVGPTLGRRWPNVYCQHSPNVMPALNLMHRLADVQPMSSQCQVNI